MIRSLYTLLLWFPTYAFGASALCTSMPALRRRALGVFFVPVLAAVSLMFAVSFPCAPTAFLGLAFGRYCLLLAIPIALLSGAWLGILGTQAAKARISPAWIPVVLVAGFLCSQYLIMLPEACWREINAGGSGGWGMSGPADMAERIMLAIHQPFLAPVFRVFPVWATFWVPSALITLLQLGLLWLLFVRVRRGLRHPESNT